MLRILEMNDINPVVVQHWRELDNGNITIQSMFDGVVREFSGVYGDYVKSHGKQLNLKGVV